MRFPINTLALPYACLDPRCACVFRIDEDENAAVPRHSGGRWFVDVVRKSDGLIVDVICERTLNKALEAVHREYPGATFNPED